MLRVLKQLIATISILAFLTTSSHATFIQSDWYDPCHPGVGTNRHAYSFNAPVNKSDPNGNCLAGCAGDRALLFGGPPGWGVLGVIALGAYVYSDIAAPQSGLFVGNDIIPIGTERRFGNLETIDPPSNNAPQPELEELSDEELIEALFNPEDGQRIKVRGNRVLDGNGRLAGRRGLFGDDNYIPGEELEDDYETATWENDDDDESPDE